MAKLCWRVPSMAGSALKPGALTMVHSGEKFNTSSFVGRKNKLFAKIL